MEITIRQEQLSDHAIVFQLIAAAFRDEMYSDKREQFLVARLRNTEDFIPDLSLVAEVDGRIVAYILLTAIKIISTNEEIPSLALAPVAVLPVFQGKGLGAALIEKAHGIARDLGYQSVIVLGHEKYYPKFGYQPLHYFNLSLPFEAPPENCMAIELVPGALKGLDGKVVYPAAFFE
ncbi:MAG: N-acetyltransferase [Taibaiella sp.]|nr:N-acetyltransferase [Taibaiella sp.]